MEAPLGEPFEIMLFGRIETGKLHPTRHGWWVYRGPSGEFGLGELRALIAYGYKRRISPLEQVMWMRRLDREAGVDDRDPLELPLPSDASPATRQVAWGIGLLLTVRSELWPSDEPFAFAREFVKAWCGVTDDGERKAMRELERLGLIERAGRSGRAILWRLADRHLIDLLAKRRAES